jgi:hypothetical protein
MRSGVGVVVRRLRARRGEIEDAIFAGVRVAVPEPGGERDMEYVEGLRRAVAAAVEFGFAGIERGGDPVRGIPAEAVAQARRAARSGVGLESVLRRYIAGHALLWDYVMQEADRVERTGQASGLREMSRAQAGLLDQLVIGVTREHVAELQRAGRSREQRLFERVRMLLADAGLDDGVPRGAAEFDSDYDLEGQHLGVIARGTGCEGAVRSLAQALDRRVLCVAPGAGTVWAWLGGSHPLRAIDLERALSAWLDDSENVGVGDRLEDLRVAVGEPASALAGWRLTHRQAQEALAVSLRCPQQRLTRYGDVALLAAALKDDTLSRSLIDMYIAPLQDPGSGEAMLLHTLRTYLAAERNASSAASVLKVARSTVLNRLRTIEERLGRPLHSCPAELEVALHLDELRAAEATQRATVGDISSSAQNTA